MHQMGKTNLKTMRERDDEAAKREPPSAGLKGLVGQLQDKPHFRENAKNKKRVRHINESDEKELRDVSERALDAGLRVAEKVILGHKDSLLEEINTLGLTRNDVSKLVEMKHDFDRRQCLGQAMHEVTDKEFRPITLEVMHEDTGECAPLFSERKHLRRERADAVS